MNLTILSERGSSRAVQTSKEGRGEWCQLIRKADLFGIHQEDLSTKFVDNPVCGTWWDHWIKVLRWVCSKMGRNIILSCWTTSC